MLLAAALAALAAAAKRNSSNLNAYDTFTTLSCAECTTFKDTIWCTEGKGDPNDNWIYSKHNRSVPVTPLSPLGYNVSVGRYTLKNKLRDFGTADAANAGKYCWTGACHSRTARRQCLGRNGVRAPDRGMG